MGKRKFSFFLPFFSLPFFSFWLPQVEAQGLEIFVCFLLQIFSFFLCFLLFFLFFVVWIKEYTMIVCDQTPGAVKFSLGPQVEAQCRDLCFILFFCYFFNFLVFWWFVHFLFFLFFFRSFLLLKKWLSFSFFFKRFPFSCLAFSFLLSFYLLSFISHDKVKIPGVSARNAVDLFALRIVFSNTRLSQLVKQPNLFTYTVQAGVWSHCLKCELIIGGNLTNAVCPAGGNILHRATNTA